MSRRPDKPHPVALLALPESTASVLYGIYDVLNSIGWAWPSLSGEPAQHAGFGVSLVSHDGAPFRCFGGIQVTPHGRLDEVPAEALAVVPDIAMDPRGDPRGRWPEVTEWLATHYARGGLIATVCTGSVLLAETGLLDGRQATTHWAFKGLFERCYPKVELRTGRLLVAADPEARLVTSGGVASWEELCLYLIGRFCSQEEAIRTAKFHLLGDRSDGQLPFAMMVPPGRHGDAAIADSQSWIADHYSLPSPVTRMIERSGLPERSFKRRFKAATGFSPVGYVQTLRIEEAKQQLERTPLSTEEIAAAIGYEDAAFFRRLFKRHTGVTPARYRQRVRRMLRCAETVE